jgi:dihydroorotase
VRFDTLIRQATVCTSTKEQISDVGISDGKIAAIGDLGSAVAENILDARHLHLLPGGIDTQVHFREPGLTHKEDIESGTRCAIHGGITSILEMPNTNPNTTSAERLQEKLDIGAATAWCHYGFFIGASTENADQLAELERLPGTPGVKIFMGSSTGSLLVSDDDDLRRVLRSGRKRCAIHAEDEPRNRERKALISQNPHPREHPFLRDATSALLATQRILRLSEETGRPVHVLHISTMDEIPVIEDAKKRGIGTTMEVLPQHIYFSAPECYARLGSLAQMNPPIRSEEHRQGILAAVQRGSFDIFGSDHAPHTLEEKAQTYPASPSGMPGVQTLLPVLLTMVNRGWFPLSTVVRMLCENPAKLYGIQGKGHLEVGYDADLVLVDLKQEKVVNKQMLQTKCGWSPYEGDTLTGWPTHVFLNGSLVVENDERLPQRHARQLVFA